MVEASPVVNSRVDQSLTDPAESRNRACLIVHKHTVAQVRVQPLDPLNAKGLPNRCGAGAGGPDFPIGRIVGIAVDIEKADRLHVHVGRIHDLPIFERFENKRPTRRGVAWFGQTDNVHILNARRFLGRCASVDGQATIHHIHHLGLHQRRVAVGHGGPIVDTFDIDGVHTIVVGGVAHGHGHFVASAREFEFPELSRFDVHQRIESLIGFDIAFARLIGVVTRPAIAQSIRSHTKQIARVAHVAGRNCGFIKLKVHQISICRQQFSAFQGFDPEMPITLLFFHLCRPEFQAVSAMRDLPACACYLGRNRCTVM
jgi:hypothetical protein